jgi:group I intron endonuclease
METQLTNYKSLPPFSGIYHILNSQNGKFYVGSAKNLRERIGRHYKGKRSNLPLQKAFNKYGKESFTVGIEVWDSLSSKDLLEIEQWYLDIYYSNCWEGTYNISPIAGGGNIRSYWDEDKQREFRQKISGENHPMFGKKHSSESKQKMSESRKGENNHLFGKERSDST